MPADYEAFYVYDQDSDGVITAVPSGVSVILYNITQAATPSASPLSTNSSGQIVAGTLADADPGDRVAFRVDGRNGVSGSVVQIVT